MAPTLSSVLSLDDLPIAELCAARLDGELFGIADCFVPGDLPDVTTVRAAALRADLPHQRLIAELHSAAWIWGVLDLAPRPHRLAAAIGARVGRRSSPGVRVREVVIADEDRVEIAGLAVTTPFRTALDLLRAPTFALLERELVQRLMVVGGFGARECREGIEARRNLPHKHEARTRLSTLGQPEFTR